MASKKNIASDIATLIAQKKNGVTPVTKDYTGIDTVDKIDPSKRNTTPTIGTSDTSNDTSDASTDYSWLINAINNGAYKTSNTTALENQASAYASQKPTWDNDAMSQAMMEAYNNYANQDAFSYDLNADALYNQYKNQYMSQGKLAMQDAIGTAAQLTGGYGNSYAQTAGSQAYQTYLDKLNNVVPTLYENAYSKYQDESDKLYNQYAIQKDLYDDAYSKYQDKLSEYTTEQNRLDELAQQAAENDLAAYETSLSASGTTSSGTDTSDSTLSISDLNKIYSTLDGFDSIDKVETYLDSLEGKLSQDQIDKLYSAYRTAYDNKTFQNSWSLSNTAGMAENNDGETMTLYELRKALIEKGMTKTEADAYIDKLSQGQ